MTTQTIKNSKYNKRMNKKVFSLIILGLLLSQMASAQKDFKDAYILLTKNDTLFGKIVNANYSTNAVYCDFQKENSAVVKRYFPNKIYGYRFLEGKYYVSKEIETKDNETIILFLEYLINGELDVYFYQENGTINHYLVAKDEMPLKELHYSTSLVTIDGKLFEKESRPYVGVLGRLTREYPELREKIVKIKTPSHEKLIKFGRDYHQLVCNNNECVIYEKKIPYRIFIEFIGGYKIRSLDNGNYINPSVPFFGFKGYINNPQFSENSYFGVGFIYEGKANIIVRLEDYIYTQTSERSSYHIYKVPITYGYMSPKKGLSPIFFGGMNFRPYHGYLPTLSFIPGLKLEAKKYIVKLNVEFEFISLVFMPVAYYATNISFGLLYKLPYKKTK